MIYYVYNCIYINLIRSFLFLSLRNKNEVLLLRCKFVNIMFKQVISCTFLNGIFFGCWSLWMYKILFKTISLFFLYLN